MKIINAALIAALAAAPAAAIAGGATTVSGAPMCISEVSLDRAQRANRAGDMKSIQAILDRRECFMVTGGHRVTILTPTHMTPGKAHIMLMGHELWTLPGGIER